MNLQLDWKNRLFNAGLCFGLLYGWWLVYLQQSGPSIFYALPGSIPERVGEEIEFRDWVRDMVIDGDTLFVADCGMYFAFDLTDPVIKPAGEISWTPQCRRVYWHWGCFYDVDARNGKLLLLFITQLKRVKGGVDAIVFDYDPYSKSFTLKIYYNWYKIQK